MKDIQFLKAKQLTTLVAIFISDLHLHISAPHTTQAFYNLLTYEVIKAKYLYLLGDLFEYWAGDDDIITPYNRKIIDALRYLNNHNVQVFLLAGNRDFLIGLDFAKAAHLKLLTEPHVIQIQNRNIALVHGDAQCTDDQAYMTFRIQVRQLAWQQKFLAMPLSRRKAVIEHFRQNNSHDHSNKSYKIIDLNANALCELYDRTKADTLIHGHTHCPALHHNVENNRIRLRYVLPDWEYDTALIRGGWISLMSDGTLHRFDAYGNTII